MLTGSVQQGHNPGRCKGSVASECGCAQKGETKAGRPTPAAKSFLAVSSSQTDLPSEKKVFFEATQHGQIIRLLFGVCSKNSDMKVGVAVQNHEGIVWIWGRCVRLSADDE